MSKKNNRQQLRGEVSTMGREHLGKYRKGGSSISGCSEIPDPDTRKMTIEISNVRADIFESKHSHFAASLRGKDFSLVNIGFTSMQMVSRVNMIRKQYQKKLTIENLQTNNGTVCDIEVFLLEMERSKKQPRYARNAMADLARLKKKA
jgi:hypothetical protein